MPGGRPRSLDFSIGQVDLLQGRLGKTHDWHRPTAAKPLGNENAIKVL